MSPAEGTNSPRQTPAHQRAQFLYYSLYQDGGPRPSKQAFKSATEDERNALIGRLYIKDIPPPRAMPDLKRLIARLEGFTGASDVQDIFFSFTTQAVDDAERLDFSIGAPGTDENDPLEVIFVDGTTNNNQGSQTPPTPQAPPNTQLRSLLLISDHNMWAVDANGFAEPKTDSPGHFLHRDPESMPGWARGRPNASPQPFYSYGAGLVLGHSHNLNESSSLLVDTQTDVVKGTVQALDCHHNPGHLLLLFRPV
ncbi:hypothetical protein DL93DRAFT_2223029 [Clavulina sp. PMI_390]|nr:hypothetical protein DL93DRAFT_2223029 [Clavulina sp. PMI_390]